jgi:hypothetical protein
MASFRSRSFDHGGQVVGVGVHVIAGRRLVRATVAAAVMGDHPVAVLGHEQHLAVPGVGAERPAVGEDDRPTLAPVLEEDARTVFRRHEAHDGFP